MAKLPANLKPGTRLDCNVRGRVFTATVLARTPTGVRVSPPSGITYHHVTAKQVARVHKWDPYATQITEG
jgi:hypothetical protein